MKIKPGFLLNFTILLAIGIACKSIDREDGVHNLSGNSLCTAIATFPPEPTLDIDHTRFFRIQQSKVMTSQDHGTTVKNQWQPSVYFNHRKPESATEIAYYKKTKSGGAKLVRHEIKYIGKGAFNRVFLLQDEKLAGKDLVLKLQRPAYGAEPSDYIRMSEYDIDTGGVAVPVFGRSDGEKKAYNIIAYGEFVKGKSPETPQDFPDDGIGNLVEYINKKLPNMAPSTAENFTLPNDIRSVNVIVREVDKTIVPVDVGFQNSKLFRDNKFTTKTKALQLFGAYFLFEMLSIDVLRHDSNFSNAVDEVDNILSTRGLGSSLGETHQTSIKNGIDKLATTLKSDEIQPIFNAFYETRLKDLPVLDRANIKNRLFERLAACLYPGFTRKWCVGEIKNFLEQQEADTLASSLFDLKEAIKKAP